MKSKTLLFLMMVICLFETLPAQENKVFDADQAFLDARDIAFSGNYESARSSLKELLTDYPDYIDAELLIAKTLSWDKDYDTARKHFNRITSKEKLRKDIWVATIKNEIYANNLNIALGLSYKALVHISDDEITGLKASIEKKIEESREIYEQLQEKNKNEDKTNAISVASQIQVFDQIFEPFYQSTIGYHKKTKYGTIIPKVTFAQRFKQNALQFELDAYPKFSKNMHGYFNYGYSNAAVLPTHRAGAELYKELPKALEMSLGARFLTFTDDAVTILTGSFGMYKGNYYLSARPYISPRKNGETGFAFTLLGRKYLRDGDNYFGVTLGYGMNGDANQLVANGQLLAETLVYLESQQLLLEHQFTAKNNPNKYKINLGLQRQELEFDSGNFAISVTAGLSYQLKF